MTRTSHDGMGEHSGAPVTRRLHLIRGDDRWVFQWEPGGERALMEAAMDLARRPEAPFSVHDAATVCRQVARRAGQTAAQAPDPEPGPA